MHHNQANQTDESKVTNISGYLFVDIDQVEKLQKSLKMRCQDLQLKGTILLSCEGVNINLAGEDGGVQSFMRNFRKDERFSQIKFKLSYSSFVPFQRLRVRLKKEIICMKQAEVKPVQMTGEHLSAQAFKKMYDDGVDMTVLDTRNDYEIGFGTFKDAVNLNIKHFSDFPQASDQLPQSAKEKPLVMFCTGGVRCEKAAVPLMKKGFKKVYQLDGGILKYFEECGGAHYEGDCFVFDERMVLDTNLQETGATQCKVCSSPVTQEEQQLDAFVEGQSCQYCLHVAKGDPKWRIRQKQLSTPNTQQECN